MKLKWDHCKDWEGVRQKHLVVRIGDEKKHWREWERKAKGAWEHIRRLSRLPPRAKKQIVQGQLLPLLTYGVELHQNPTEPMRQLLREWQRCVVGAWRGSNADRVEELSGILDIDSIIRYQRVR